MPKPPSQTKKLLNNGRLRAELAAVLTLCDTAEAAAEDMEIGEVAKLCKSDRDLRRAISRWKADYSEQFGAVEQRLLES